MAGLLSSSQPEPQPVASTSPTTMMDTWYEEASAGGGVSSIYGPVHSWRVGWSLGVDLLLNTSTCSFNCVYCQLGDIQLKTIERKIYVPTTKVERDLRESDWEKADIITLSGSGEPTLALNLGEVIHMIKEYTRKPVMVLTNATLLHDPTVRADLRLADVVSCKLDAATDAVLQRMNRPVAGVTLDQIVDGIRQLRAEHPGRVALQCMFMPTNMEDYAAVARLAQNLNPHEVQLNTPRRPYPLTWVVDSRGNHSEVTYCETRTLRTIDELTAQEIEQAFRDAAPEMPVNSIYKKG